MHVRPPARIGEATQRPANEGEARAGQRAEPVPRAPTRPRHVEDVAHGEALGAVDVVVGDLQGQPPAPGVAERGGRRRPRPQLAAGPGPGRRAVLCLADGLAAAEGIVGGATADTRGDCPVKSRRYTRRG